MVGWIRSVPTTIARLERRPAPGHVALTPRRSGAPWTRWNPLMLVSHLRFVNRFNNPEVMTIASKARRPVQLEVPSNLTPGSENCPRCSSDNDPAGEVEVCGAKQLFGRAGGSGQDAPRHTTGPQRVGYLRPYAAAGRSAADQRTPLAPCPASNAPVGVYVVVSGLVLTLTPLTYRSGHEQTIIGIEAEDEACCSIAISAQRTTN